MPRSRSRLGFTLVELLVVIAILAVLMSLLLPVLKSAIESARVAVCASNLKSHHNAIHMVALDHPSGRLPSSDGDLLCVSILPNIGGYRGNPFGIHTADLMTYGYTEDIGACPGVTSDTGGARRRSFYYWYDGIGRMNGNDYIYSGGISQGIPDSPAYGFRFGKRAGIYVSLDLLVKHPAFAGGRHNEEMIANELVYVSDTTYNSLDSYPGWYYAPYTDPSNHRDEKVSDKRGRSIWPAQGRGSNRLHADGSVRWFNLATKYRMRGNHARLPNHQKAYIRDYSYYFW